MTYKGDEIGCFPTIAMVECYIAEKGLFVEPQDAFDYWEKKKWLTKSGVPPKTLESAINVVNGIYVSRELLKQRKKVKTKETKKQNKKLEKLKAKELYNEELLKRKENKKNSYIKYEEQMKDQRWLAFRNFVFCVRGYKCENCGSTKTLQIHHPKYFQSRKAWEYTCNEVVVLCKECHQKCMA